MFHWSDWRKVSRTFLSILFDLNNAVVWMVTILPLIYNSSNSNLLGTVPRVPLSSSITVSLTFNNFCSVSVFYGRRCSVCVCLDMSFCSFGRFKYISIGGVIFTPWSTRTINSARWQVPFLLIAISPGLLVGIWWSVCILKPHRSLYISCSWSVFNLLHNSQ